MCIYEVNGDFGSYLGPVGAVAVCGAAKLVTGEYGGEKQWGRRQSLPEVLALAVGRWHPLPWHVPSLAGVLLQPLGNTGSK